MSPQGSASIWIFIELTLAFLATVYKRMPIGFYLVASNKPRCLTCMQTTAHNTTVHKHTHTDSFTFFKLPKQFALSVFKWLGRIFFFLWQLFGFISPGLKQRIADFIFFHACTMIVYLFCIIEISDQLRGNEHGFSWPKIWRRWFLMVLKPFVCACACQSSNTNSCLLISVFVSLS